LIRIKICGITNIEDALLAAESGAHALGFVFAKSPRQVNPATVRRIVKVLPPFISRVGVFVNEDSEVVKEIAGLCGLDVVQLHGDESPAYCNKFSTQVIKAIRVKDRSVLPQLSKYEVDALLLDAFVPGKPGGTGKSFNWDIAAEAKEYGRIILSGGLSPENVAEAIARADPYGVDVSSGVEAEQGKKDPKKVRAFIRAAAGF
jgi:phosphoribosylanthranilate isomerase